MVETDVYRHLPQKIKKFYSWGLQNTKATWFLKTDTDFYVRIESLQKYLLKQEKSTVPTIFSSVADGWGVLREGKWAENNYKKKTYPKFPIGSAGHIVNRIIGAYISNNTDSLFNYQGEDVSLGIWMDESPFSQAVKWINLKYMTNSGNCFDKQKFVIGHNVNENQKKKCYEQDRRSHHLGTILNETPPPKKWMKVNLIGRLGNNLFQLASGIGLSYLNDMLLCIPGSDRKKSLSIILTESLPPECPSNVKFVKETERGYAKHQVFETNDHTEIGDYLQSWKYFQSISKKIKRMFRFNPSFFMEANHLSPKRKYNINHLIGIHVRRGDKITVDAYLRFPDDNYFESIFVEFPNSKVLVVSEDIPWCKTFHVFKKHHERIFFQEKKVNPVVDMILLSMCDVVVLTMGTFGWWGAFF